MHLPLQKHTRGGRATTCPERCARYNWSRRGQMRWQYRRSAGQSVEVELDVFDKYEPTALALWWRVVSGIRESGAWNIIGQIFLVLSDHDAVAFVVSRRAGQRDSTIP